MKKSIIQIFILAIVLILITSGCVKQKETNQKAADKIVLIFHNPPSQKILLL